MDTNGYKVTVMPEGVEHFFETKEEVAYFTRTMRVCGADFTVENLDESIHTDEDQSFTDEDVEIAHSLGILL